MTIQEAQALLAQGIIGIGGDFRYMDGPPKAYTDRGTIYTTYSAEGEKKEGSPIGLVSPDPELIVRSFLRMWHDLTAAYKRRGQTMVIWRQFPTVSEHESVPDPFSGTVTKYYKVTCRVAFE